MDHKLRDVPFVKMTGSGNDFVFFDGRTLDSAAVTAPRNVVAICDRHNGIGADGVVVLEVVPTPTHTSASGAPAVAPMVRILYFNSDGSAADLCGNATLCSTALATAIGLSSPDGVSLLTPSGAVPGRLAEGLPEIGLPPVHSVVPASDIALVDGESRVGFAIAGIPHLVLLCDDVAQVDVLSRGAELRWHTSAGPTGANVNWVSQRDDGTWRYRTFERGVEGETLACGTGAVATAVLLATWGLAGNAVRLLTSSGRPLDVTIRPPESPAATTWSAQLRGEGRIVFRGTIGDLGGAP